MLSFIFVMVSGLFDESVQVCYRLFIYVLPLQIQLSKREGLTPPHRSACLRRGPEFPIP